MIRTDSENVINISKLVKKFGRFRALDGLDLTVGRGEVHGFLGPNGAGKSTTIRILLGLLRKTEGKVSLLGEDPWAKAVDLHRKLAYVPGDVNLWPNLSGGECIDLFGALRGGLDKKRRADLLKRFELDPTKKSRTYSKGNRQKVALVAALASDVDIYILDEPTSGLDPLMEAEFQECIRELSRAGKTVLLSSHILAEVEALCDRITIIREGRVVESGTLDELRRLTRTAIRVVSDRPIRNLDTLNGIHNVEIGGNKTKFEVDTSQLDAALRHIVQFGVRDLESAPPDLETLFVRHYADQPAGNTVAEKA